MAKDGKKVARRSPTATLAGVVEQLGGARLCYGEPVREAGRTIIPVARVRAQGGGGFGRGPDDQGGGGGGGGTLRAVPVGYIEVGPEGSRFQPIQDPDAASRALRTAGAAALAFVGAVASLRAARGRRLLGRGRG